MGWDTMYCMGITPLQTVVAQGNKKLKSRSLMRIVYWWEHWANRPDLSVTYI